MLRGERTCADECTARWGRYIQEIGWPLKRSHPISLALQTGVLAAGLMLVQRFFDLVSIRRPNAADIGQLFNL